MPQVGSFRSQKMRTFRSQLTRAGAGADPPHPGGAPGAFPDRAARRARGRRGGVRPVHGAPLPEAPRPGPQNPPRPQPRRAGRRAVAGAGRGGYLPCRRPSSRHARACSTAVRLERTPLGLKRYWGQVRNCRPGPRAGAQRRRQSMAKTSTGWTPDLRFAPSGVTSGAAHSDLCQPERIMLQPSGRSRSGACVSRSRPPPSHAMKRTLWPPPRTFPSAR